jgi:predicted acyl esterase
MNKAINNLFRALVALVFFATFASVHAQQEPFTRSDAMIPMRDGIRLNTNVYADSHQRFPTAPPTRTVMPPDAVPAALFRIG